MSIILQILHGQICARTVLVVGGERAKLAGLAMSDCQRGGDKLDITRWMANEALRSNNFTAKCDIWSLGCLLWEMATLGTGHFLLHWNTIAGDRSQIPHWNQNQYIFN